MRLVCWPTQSRWTSHCIWALRNLQVGWPCTNTRQHNGIGRDYIWETSANTVGENFIQLDVLFIIIHFVNYALTCFGLIYCPSAGGIHCICTSIGTCCTFMLASCWLDRDGTSSILMWRSPVPRRKHGLALIILMSVHQTVAEKREVMSLDGNKRCSSP
jgi:hypothetical protein